MKKPPAETSAKLGSPLSDSDRDRIEAFKRRQNEGPTPPKLKPANGGDEGVGVIEDLKDAAGFAAATGTMDQGLASHLLDQVQRTVIYSSMPRVDKCNLSLAVMHGIAPRDELEGMLAVQMVGTHNLAMAFMARAIMEGQTVDGVDACISRATKLMRTFTAQVDALNRYRGQGQQKVVVEHVHVNEGGQAIVGNVEGGGVKHGKGG